jgi:hypothetical protein
MQKTKKAYTALPKNIQLTFITAASIAFVVNALYWISLLIRVYPHGMRVSQFSIMAVGQIILPAMLFAISFIVYKKSVTRFDHLFNATVWTMIGLGLYHVVSVTEGLLLREQNIYSNIFGITWTPAISMLISLALFGGILFLLSRRNKKVNHAQRLQLSALIVIALAFVTDASFNLWGLISQHVGSKNILNLLTHQQLIVPIVLPIAFFLVAYFLVPKAGDRLNRLFTSAIYALIGVMAVTIAMIIYYIGMWALPMSDFASLHALGLQTVFATVIGLAVYTFLIITHNRSKKTLKRAR